MIVSLWEPHGRGEGKLAVVKVDGGHQEAMVQ